MERQVDDFKRMRWAFFLNKDYVLSMLFWNDGRYVCHAIFYFCDAVGPIWSGFCHVWLTNSGLTREWVPTQAGVHPVDRALSLWVGRSSDLECGHIPCHVVQIWYGDVDDVEVDGDDDVGEMF